MGKNKKVNKNTTLLKRGRLIITVDNFEKYISKTNTPLKKRAPKKNLTHFLDLNLIKGSLIKILRTIVLPLNKGKIETYFILQKPTLTINKKNPPSHPTNSFFFI